MGLEAVAWSDDRFTEWAAALSDRFEVRLQEALATSDEFVQQAARYLVDLGGKRLRPALIFGVGGLGAEVGTADPASLLEAAVVVELTHAATLYHDDVMDEAQLRRGAPTAHRLWGNSVAIMVGDFMLAQASLVGAHLGSEFMIFHAITLGRLVQGQIAETRGPADGADPFAHYLDVIAGKTASLFAASARYGATFAGLPQSQVEDLTAFGENLGMAFQLADDLLDIVSEESGKQPGTDLREGVPTVVPLLVRRANRVEDGRLLELLSAPVAEDDVPEALALLRAHPAVEETRAEIRAWANRAAGCLDSLDDLAATRALRTLCDQAATRLA